MLECPNCWRKFQAGTRFCGSCGTALTGAVPAALPPKRGTMESLANSQYIPGFQAKDSPEDTIVRKMPDGFSWRSQRAHFPNDEPPQTIGHTRADAEEPAASLPQPALPDGSLLPTVHATSLSPGVSSFPMSHAQQLVSSNPATPALVASSVFAASGSPDSVAVVGTTPRPAKAASDHPPFAIPTRPGRLPDNAVVSGQSEETADEITICTSLEREPISEVPGVSSDPAEAPIDYAACTSTMLEAALDLRAVPVSSTSDRSAMPIARPFAETFISNDLIAEIAALAASSTNSSRVPTSERERREAEEAVPTVPTTPVSFTPVSVAIAEEASEERAEEEVDVALFPTVPDTSTGNDGLEDSSYIDPTAFFAPFLKPDEVPEHLRASADPYLHLKQELAAQRMEITASMDELLPLVYENHREENQALFAYILAHRPALDDEAWGHAAFVLGAYGNYMYRHKLSFTKKLEIWRAQLWAVYYERSYRRKYLAQRCQQLIHFFQGCAEYPPFLVIALRDVETLYLYMEPGSLRKLQHMLQELPVQPVELLQSIEAQLEIAEKEKAERMARQLAPGHAQSQLIGSMSANNLAMPSRANPDGQIAQQVRGETLEDTSRALPAGARRLLGFLSEEQCHQFFASLRADRLETISQLLLQAREPILIALRAELLSAHSSEYQRPRKSVPMRQGSRNGPDYDRFAEAFRLLSSPKLKEQQIALRMFEQNARENVAQEHQQGAREWMLYARARIQGSTRVASDWERAVKRNEASWEEIWNLAYYHRVTNDLAEAMRVLTPGLDELDAPVSHLRFALICALTLLLEPDKVELSVVQNARSLLIRHLERWPHPLSCLAWLALSYETPGTVRPLDQSSRLSVFQELLEYPVNLPDPRIDLSEAQINALKDVLENKTHCEEAWFLWLNDYAARRPHNFAVWQRLAETSERVERLERAEMALQHAAGIYYDLDYVYAQEGEEEVQAASELRRHVERLFAFYRRHEMQRQAWDSFESCYTTLKHLGFWDEQKPANRTLLELVRPFLLEHQRLDVQRQQAQRLSEAQDAKARSEIRRNELSNNPTRPLEHFKAGQRVGIFVDYENITRLIPPGDEIERVWQMLASYAAQFGEVVCRWASASPRNLANLTNIRAGLEAAQFKIRYPRRELQFSASQKDLADYALLECINSASLNDRLDVYLVVSGDRDYYERIYSLLESGCIVRILANDCNLSASYRELVQQRQGKQSVAGHEESDFFIDNLDEVLHSLPPLSH